ncbi:MAG: hypothetical protein ABJE95_32490 [Byssovorax sp.]
MATKTPKTTPTAALPSKKSPAHTPTTPENAATDYNPSTGRATVASLLPRWPALDPKHRRAFQKLANDLDRSKLGARTKGIGVLQDGVAWATQMDTALRQYGTGALKAYSPARFVYFLESLTSLADQLTAARAKNKSVGAVRGTAASHREAAIAARDNLLSPLRTFAGSRDPETTALDEATGTIDPDDRLGESLADLAALARTWLALKDEDSIFLAADAGLTADLATAAVTSAKALTGSAAGARLEGHVAGNDPPLVNLAEGGVLLEMKEAMRLFGEANARHPAVKKLSPGPATRAALGKRPDAKAAPKPAQATPTTP